MKRQIAGRAAEKADELIEVLEQLANLSDREIWSGERLAVIGRIYKVRELSEFLHQFSNPV